MTATSYEDALGDARGQVQQDLLDALEAASTQLREMTDIRSAIGMREATEAILAIEIALKKYGQ